MSTQPDDNTQEESFPSSSHVSHVYAARGLLYSASARLTETVGNLPEEDLSGASCRFRRTNYQVIRAIRLLESYIEDFLEREEENTR